MNEQSKSQRPMRRIVPGARRPAGRVFGMGWLRDHADIRDSTLHAPSPKSQRDKESKPAQSRTRKAIAAHSRKLDKKVDHSKFCSPVENQGDLGSCTANACVGLVEYMERRASGRHIDASRLFLYKVTRKLLNWEGDTGAYLRTTMKALALFGVPPERQCPYVVENYEDEPDPFLYSYAQNFKAIEYLRLDPSDADRKQILQNVKAALASNYVAMFGFTTYSSLGWEADIPFPSGNDSADGGHAVLAVGYDDARKNEGTKKKGALIIRNSWGEEWGNEGYGYLPYEYVLRGLADDFWICQKLDWVNTGRFD